MSYSIFITPTASDDIAVAVEYYNALSPDLGYRFSDQVASYFDRIAASPHCLAHQQFDIRTSDANQ